MDTFTNMKVIRMKKEWDHEDNTLFRFGRFSSKGLDKYWASIDVAVKHWDTLFATKKFQKKFREACEESKSSPQATVHGARNFVEQ